MLWKKLPDKKIECHPHQLRVLQFDPKVLPTDKIYPYNRFHSLAVRYFFPNVEDLCGCGCGLKLTGRQKQWATNDCSFFAWDIRNIICGRLDTIQRYMRIYNGWVCSKCGGEDKGHDMGANGTVSWIKIDHIIPVKLGGGGCWLSNYQLLCHDCHIGKTNKDFNWKQKAEMPTLF